MVWGESLKGEEEDKLELKWMSGNLIWSDRLKTAVTAGIPLHADRDAAVSEEAGKYLHEET